MFDFSLNYITISVWKFTYKMSKLRLQDVAVHSLDCSFSRTEHYKNF